MVAPLPVKRKVVVMRKINKLAIAAVLSMSLSAPVYAGTGFFDGLFQWLASFEEYFNELWSEVDSLNAEVPVIQGDIDELKNDIAASNDAIGTLRESMGSMAEDIDFVVEGLDLVIAGQGSMAVDVSNNAGLLADHELRITELEAAVHFPAMVRDANGQYIGSWTSQEDGVGFISLDLWPEDSLRIFVRYTNLSVGDFTGVLGNKNTTWVNSCDSPRGLVGNPEGYVWVINDTLYKSTGKSVNVLSREIVDINGECTPFEYAYPGLFAKRGINELKGFYDQYPTPWEWTAN